MKKILVLAIATLLLVGSFGCTSPTSKPPFKPNYSHSEILTIARESNSTVPKDTVFLRYSVSFEAVHNGWTFCDMSCWNVTKRVVMTFNNGATSVYSTQEGLVDDCTGKITWGKVTY